MVAVAQFGRAPDCGSGCRGFESHQPPHFAPPKVAPLSHPRTGEAANLRQGISGQNDNLAV